MPSTLTSPRLRGSTHRLLSQQYSRASQDFYTNYSNQSQEILLDDPVVVLSPELNSTFKSPAKKSVQHRKSYRFGKVTHRTSKINKIIRKAEQLSSEPVSPLINKSIKNQKITDLTFKEQTKGIFHNPRQHKAEKIKRLKAQFGIDGYLEML